MTSRLSFLLFMSLLPPSFPADTLLSIDPDHSTYEAPGPENVRISEDAVLYLTPGASRKDAVWVRIANQAPLNQGEFYRLSFEMRAVEGEQEAAGQAGVQLTFGGVPAEGAYKREVIEKQTVAVVGTEWDAFVIDLKLGRGYAKGEARLEITPAFFKETVEIRNLRVTGFGNEAPPRSTGNGEQYPGHAPDAAWREASRKRIETHRKAPITLHIRDEWGNPIQGATAEIRMTRHEYLFGTCAKAFRLTDAELHHTRPEYNREAWLADNVIYRERMQSLFNFVVLENDMKWPSWAGQWPNRRQEVTMDALRWLKQKGLVAKGHTILWGSWRQSPKYLQEKQDKVPELRTAIEQHIRDQAAAMKDWVQYADVLNEPAAHRDLIEAVGADQVATWFKIAKQEMPEVQLVINEFDILGNGGSTRRQDHHEALIRDLLKDGAPIDVLGFQSHFWSTRLTPPERLYEIIDRFAAFDLPLMVSEFDMNLLDEDLQADYTRDFLLQWFSHPATEAYIMWGFWAKAHWFGEPGAMYRQDWTPKPNLNAYTDLVLGEWWTEESLTSDKQGAVSLRAFKGDYEIVVTAPGRNPSVRRPTLRKEGLDMTVILYPAPTP